MGSQAILDEIRNRLSIVSFIGETVPLKRAGRNFKGLCPFHQEKTPSFMVTEEKQIFHCFGCGAGGDLFTFLMKLNSLTFPEALKELAKRAGVTLPTFSKEQRSAEEELGRRKEMGLALNKLASDYFIQTLSDKTKGKEARDYLTARGLKNETIQQNLLGFADKSWDGLYKKLTSAKAPLKMAEELGLIRKGDQNYYDFFRERIIFPIHDVQGNIIAFGGRTINEKEETKYLNSSDSFLYNKSKTVFGLHLAKEAIRKTDEVILVEGYMDCLSLRQAGILNVVAPLGTALTLDHLRFLSRYTKNFVLAFDGDSAGKKAAGRALSLFVEMNLTPKGAEIPSGMDPDSFVLQKGKEGWEQLLAKAPTLFEYFVSNVLKEEGEGTQETLRAWEKIKPVLDKIKNPLEAGMYRKIVAAKLGVEERWLSGQRKEDSRREISSDAQREFPKEERLLIAAMILKPALIDKVKGAGEIFSEPALKKIATQLFLKSADKESVTIASLRGEIPEDLASWIREMALAEEEDAVWEKAVDDVLNKIAAKSLGNIIQRLNKEIVKAEARGDENELSKLLGQKTKLVGVKTL